MQPAIIATRNPQREPTFSSYHRDVRGLLAWVVLCAGCDGVFGLTHVALPADGSVAGDAPRDAAADARTPDAPPDSGCAVATGATMTKHFGARTGGVAAAGAHDTFLSNDTAHLTSNFGGVDKIFVCYQCSCQTDCESISGGDDDVVALVRFDFSADIPPCSKVTAASLTIDTTSDNLGGGSSIAISAVLEDWTEGVGVVTGSVGTANWEFRANAQAWLDPGVGPGGSRGVLVGSFAPNNGNTSYNVAIDLAVVQQWIDTPATNHGMLMTITGSTSDVHFWSKEYTDPSKRPGFQITYKLP